MRAFVSLVHQAVILGTLWCIFFVQSPQVLGAVLILTVIMYVFAKLLDGCILTKYELRFAGLTPTEIIKRMMISEHRKLSASEFELIMIGFSVCMVALKLVLLLFMPRIRFIVSKL
jgi:hypothetical protein